MALLGSVAIGLLYPLVRPYLGRTVALIAGLLGVYHFGLYVLSIARSRRASTWSCFSSSS